jgi:hypothetical protein
MSDGPVVLGVNRTQDASICLMQGSRIIFAIQKERLTRQKHHWGRLDDFRNVYAPLLAGFDKPVDVLVECYSSDTEAGNLAAYRQELEQVLNFAPGCRRARISHHLSHVYSVFHPSPFRDAAVMIIDGQGSPVSEFTEQWSGAQNLPGDWREVSSFYRADRQRIECVGKQLWDRDEQRLVGLGMFYFLLTQAIFPGEGNEGKVMGLAPHGNPDALGLPSLDVDGAQVTIPARWTGILHERGRFRYVSGERSRFVDIANLAAAGQRAFEDAVLEVARWLHRRTGAENLCFAGGTALNCSTNDRLLRETPFRNVFIPPAPSDAGTSAARYTDSPNSPANAAIIAGKTISSARNRNSPISKPRCATPATCSWNTSNARPIYARAWSICCATAGWSGCTRAAASSGRARSGTAASSAIRAMRMCATGSIRGSRSANGFARWRLWCCSNARKNFSISAARRRSCSSPRRCCPKRLRAFPLSRMSIAPRACKPSASMTIHFCVRCCRNSKRAPACRWC